jgi:hypothetical protein
MGSAESAVQPLDTVFYPLRRGVSVTGRRLRVYGQIYKVAALSDLRQVPLSTQHARRVVVRIVAVEAVIVAGIVVVTPSLVAVAIVAGYVLSAAAAIWISIRRWPTPMELSAEYRGTPVVLFVSTDRTEFQLVSWAVLRAMERHLT